VTASTPPPDGSPAGSEPLPLPPDSTNPLPQAGLSSFGLDRLGVTQAVGGLALGLIALISSDDHISVAGYSLPIAQQWGIRQIEERTKQIVNETEQLRQENARGRQRLASIDALCFPPESSSTHPNPIEPDSRPSSL
jgi:hypothetical protein